MGRPPRVDDDELLTLVEELSTANNRGWATTAEIAAELPMEADSVRKRLNQVVNESVIERWKPYSQGGFLWRIDPDAELK
jgi:predicted transcriptional regulator